MMLNKKAQQGILLLEVLISILILAFGLLGIASLLLISNQANNSSYAKQQAVQIVYNMFDRIRANSQAAINGNYTVTNIGSNGYPIPVNTPSTLCISAPCTAAQLASYDTWIWLTQDVSLLPNGSGSISTAPNGTSGNTLVTVTVQWDDSLAIRTSGASSQISATNPNFVQISIQSQL